jgi:hypothetical protein
MEDFSRSQKFEAIKRELTFLRLFDSVEAIRDRSDARETFTDYQMSLQALKKAMKDGNISVAETGIAKDEMDKFETLANSQV